MTWICPKCKRKFELNPNADGYLCECRTTLVPVLVMDETPKTDQINDGRQNLRLPQERKDAYAKDAQGQGLDLPEYTRQALAEKHARTWAKILERLTAIEKALQELTKKVDRSADDTLGPFAPTGTGE